MHRFLIRYEFTKPSDMISGTDAGRKCGVYISAPTAEEAFRNEQKMWACWGAEIKLLESEMIR